MATTGVSSTTNTTSTATSSTSTSSTSASATAAANAKVKQNIIKTLGAGSGIDTNALAQSLVDAERIPAEDAINTKITKSEAKISGYAAITFSANQLKDAFSALNDVSDFNSLAVRNSNTSAFGVTTSSFASLGDYQIDVKTLARPQRSVSDGFASPSTALSASDFTLKLAIHGGAATDIAITAAKSAPADMVDAINSAGLGVTAQLVNTGDSSGASYKFILTGTSGETQDFTLTSDDGSGTPVAGLNFNTDSPLHTATDASVVINGVTFTRSTNVITDAVKGVTLDLYSTTSTPATVNMTRDTSALKEKFKTLVTAYNDAQSMMNVLGDRNSTVDQYGGSLFGDSTVRTMKSMFRDMILGASTTPGTNATYLWQAGINLTKDGPIELDETKLDAALTGNFDNVVKMMTGNKQSLTSFSTDSAGIAGEAVRKLTKLVATDGILTKQTDSSNTQIDRYKKDLEALTDRMDKLLKRYQTDLGAMDTFVSQSNSTRASLTQTFKSMSNSGN
jgi:flagellar hook-associated protein 2